MGAAVSGAQGVAACAALLGVGVRRDVLVVGGLSQSGHLIKAADICLGLRFLSLCRDAGVAKVVLPEHQSTIWTEGDTRQFGIRVFKTCFLSDALPELLDMPPGVTLDQRVALMRDGLTPSATRGEGMPSATPGGSTPTSHQTTAPPSQTNRGFSTPPMQLPPRDSQQQETAGGTPGAGNPDWSDDWSGEADHEDGSTDGEEASGKGKGQEEEKGGEEEAEDAGRSGAREQEEEEKADAEEDGKDTKPRARGRRGARNSDQSKQHVEAYV